MFLLAFDSNSSPPLHYTFEFPSSHSSNGLVEQCISNPFFGCRFNFVMRSNAIFSLFVRISLSFSLSLSLYVCLSRAKFASCLTADGSNRNILSEIIPTAKSFQYIFFFLITGISVRLICVRERARARLTSMKMAANAESESDYRRMIATVLCRMWCTCCAFQCLQNFNVSA